MKTEDLYSLLNELEEDGAMNQRQVASRTGISLGKINQLLRHVVDQGWVGYSQELHEFDRDRGRYKLTDVGISQKRLLGEEYLRQKEEEFSEIAQEIEGLKKVLGVEG